MGTAVTPTRRVAVRTALAQLVHLLVQLLLFLGQVCALIRGCPCLLLNLSTITPIPVHVKHVLQRLAHSELLEQQYFTILNY